MAKVILSNVTVHNAQAKFLSNFTFEIQFECLEQLTQELEFKLIYVGSSESSDHDQVLDIVVIDAVGPGTYKFLFEAPAPDPKKLPIDDVVGVTIVLVMGMYRNQEFARVGYYVLNEYDDLELKDNPPLKVDFEKLCRTIAVDDPRVTTFPIIWEEKEKIDQLPFPLLSEEERNMATMSDELESVEDAMQLVSVENGCEKDCFNSEN